MVTFSGVPSNVCHLVAGHMHAPSLTDLQMPTSDFNVIRLSFVYVSSFVTVTYVFVV